MPCVIVLGHHRSGTSALAGALHHLGVHMGDRLLVGNVATNPKGHYEDTELVMLNERAISGDWRNPKVIQAPIYRQRFKTYVENRAERAPSAIWGVKDPRLCFTLPLFLEALRADDMAARIVTSVRSRADVVRSLEKRGALNGVPPDVVYDRYQVAIESAIARFKEAYPVEEPRFVEYDSLVGFPQVEVLALMGWLGMKLEGQGAQRADEAVAFLEPSLRHWRGGEAV